MASAKTKQLLPIKTHSATTTASMVSTSITAAETGNGMDSPPSLSTRPPRWTENEVRSTSIEKENVSRRQAESSLQTTSHPFPSFRLLTHRIFIIFTLVG